MTASVWPESSRTQQLISQARSGSPTAIDQLLQQHREALRRMIELRMDRAIQQRVDASDVVQEVLIEAARRLPDYLAQPLLPFHLWLRQMAKDRLIDAHRRHRGAARRSLDRERSIHAAFADHSSLDLAAALRDKELTPAAAALRQELARRFEAAIARLDDTDREVIQMRHFEQLSNQEVALALGLSEPAAGMRYLRALRRLRPLLDEAPSQPGEP